jgi:hypothetical protein
LTCVILQVDRLINEENQQHNKSPTIFDTIYIVLYTSNDKATVTSIAIKQEKMRLFRRVGSRSTDASDTPSSQDPQLTALRYDTQTTLLNNSEDNNLNLTDNSSKPGSRNEGDHIKHLQQIFKPPSNQPFSSYVARSVTNSPKISGMPKSKVAGDVTFD